MHREKLPPNWKWVKVEYVTFPVKKVQPKNNPEKPFVYIDISSIDNNIQKITDPKEYIGKDAPSRARQLIEKNDVLFSTVRTYLMNIAYVPDIYDGQIASTGFSVLRSKDIVDPKFLYYYCLTKEFLEPLNSLQRGTSYPAVRDGDVRAQPFPLAPLVEQRLIVSKIEELFSQLDAGVAGLKRAQAALKRYRGSVLKAAFEGRLVPQDPNDEPVNLSLKKLGKKSVEIESLPKLPKNWSYAKLSDVAEVNKRDSIIKELPPNMNVSFVPMAAVDEHLGEIIYPEIRNLKDVWKGYTYFREGDVLFAKITPCMENGKAAIAKNLENGIGFGSTEFHVFKTNELIMNKYLYYFIRQKRFRSEAKANFTGTAGHMRVPTNFVKKYKIPLPPINEQRRIIQRIESDLTILEGIQNTINTNLQRSERVRQSILKKAFEGKLLPRNLDI